MTTTSAYGTLAAVPAQPVGGLSWGRLVSKRRMLEIAGGLCLLTAIIAGTHIPSGTRPVAACQTWTRTGPITNTAGQPIVVSDQDGFLPVRRLEPGQAVTFTAKLPGSVVQQVDRVTIAPVSGAVVVEDLTISRPASCRP